MTQRFLSVNGFSSGDLKKPHIIKTYSFTTEDDDDTGLISNSPKTSNHNKLLSMNSPSIDNYNNDGDSSENSKKPKKRKSRRQTELENHIEKKIPVNTKHPLINFSKLLTVIILIIVLYLMWVKRDVWINRLLTSNARIRRYGMKKDDDDKGNSTMNSSPREDIIEKTEEKKDIDEDLTSSTNNQKVNLRTRRNKMNFNQKKKPRQSQNSPIDDEEEDKPVLTSSTKTKDRSLIAKQTSPIHISTYDDIIEQLRKTLKSRRREREFFSKLSKATGLKKDQLYRFIYKKDYKIITLQTFVTILDSFNLLLLIVPK